MNTTKVRKAELLTQLQANREAHKTEFETSRKAWQEKVLARLLAVRDKAVQEDVWDDVEYPLSELPKPEHFLRSYDLAIARLEWEQDDVVELSEKEFANYVLDNWDWRGQFANTTAIYAAG